MGLNALSICEVIRGIYDDVDPQEIIKFCQDHLPHYMAPRIVILRICENSRKDAKVYFERKRNGYGLTFLGKKYYIASGVAC